MKNAVLIIVFIAISLSHFTGLFAQENKEIEFPDIPGYKSLVCDFHVHTVFSDGSVWPDIRIMEASKEGLDAISITDHLEYQPHAADIPHPDRNRPYQLALKYRGDRELLVVNGSEITRRMPPGHANAIFLEDANKLLDLDSLQVYEEAARQEAFIFWNHPHWTAQKSDGIAELTPFHRELIEKGLLHGIEVVNETTYSDEALQIALDQGLTIMGNSDIHGLTGQYFKVSEGGHRPVTLVFSTDKTVEDMKEALFSGRTVVWFNNNLIGKPEYLVPLIEASLKADTATYKREGEVARVRISNCSDAAYILRNTGDYQFHANTEVINIAPHGEIILQVKTHKQLDAFELEFEVLNAVIAPGKHPIISIYINTEK